MKFRPKFWKKIRNIFAVGVVEVEEDEHINLIVFAAPTWSLTHQTTNPKILMMFPTEVTVPDNGEPLIIMQK